ncbi:hypothetical protein RDABS01_011906, partial [Bienertia sinuspersici]
LLVLPPPLFSRFTNVDLPSILPSNLLFLAKMSTVNGMELQDDVLIEILSRLPVTSLIRFTCVCKYWLSLIKSPEFASKHYITRSNNHGKDDDSILTVFNPGLSFTIFCYEDLSIKTVFKIRPATNEPVSNLSICHHDVISRCLVIGPCNGLLLMTFTKADRTKQFDGGAAETVLLLWNPATREVFKLPQLPHLDVTGSSCAGYGFGFDDTSNDYKVVVFDASQNSSIVQLYSLAANSWRQVDAGFGFCLGRGPETSVSNPTYNGGMHNWIICYAVGYDLSLFLLSFDMANEVLVETPVPDGATVFSCGLLQQRSNNKYPTLYDFDDARTGISIWVLNQYGPTGDWTKQHYISLAEGITLGYKILLWKEGILYVNDRDPDILGNEDEITLYNLRTHQKKSLRIPADRRIVGYTESLVSIAKCVRQGQQSSAYADDQQQNSNSSFEMKLIQQQQKEHQEYLYLLNTGVHPREDELILHEEEEEDDSNSSTDSAYLRHNRRNHQEPLGCVEYTEDEIEYLDKYNDEIERLSKLPYCLREVNQPISSNPCTF